MFMRRESDRNTDPKKLEDRMRRLCSMREYCSADVMRRLSAYSADREEAGRILKGLVDDGYVDDRRYASAFARDRSSIHGWGEERIRRMLQSKGIAGEDISAALESMDSEKAEAKMNKIIQARYRSLAEDPQCRVKLLRFAAGRGYRYDQVVDLVDRLVEGRDLL